MPLLREAVEKLGFKMTDIKIILGSHAHGDHMQADAIVKEMTGGATVMAMEQDVPALKGMKAPSGKAHPIDRVLKDGEPVTLGGTTLTAHLTPGHTRGCTTWTTLPSRTAAKPYNVLIACGGLQEDARLVDNKNYPEIADDFGAEHQEVQDAPARCVPRARTAGSSTWPGKYKRLGQPPPTHTSIPPATRRGSPTWRRTTTRCSPSRRRTAVQVIAPGAATRPALRARGGRRTSRARGSPAPACSGFGRLRSRW